MCFEAVVDERQPAVGVVRAGALNGCSETSSDKLSFDAYPEHEHELDTPRKETDRRVRQI
jgi:hypothetical protein